MSIVTASRMVDLLGHWRLDGPAHERLAATIRALVLDGRIALESRLPPERALAAALGVSRATVTAAYTTLRAQGYVASRQGAGSWAAIPGGHRAAPDAGVRVDGLDMRVAALPAPPALDELARAAADELPRWLDHHGYDPLGLPQLRRAIAERFCARGLPTRPEQIMVTSGALHALDLAVRAIARPGQAAVVEIPGYPAALDVLRNAGLRLRGLPTTHAGWDIATLAALASSERPLLAYLIPDFQNPTGALIDAPSRRAVARILERTGAYVVIDETFVELDLDRVEMPPPMASFAERSTITIGSLSKPVWGGLRIGWARADPVLIERLALARATSDMASPVLEQLLAVGVLERLDELTARRRAALRRGREALAGALRAHLPAWRFTLPAGGLFLWTELPGPISTSLAVSAAERGLHVTPGPRFGGAGLLERYLRLPFTLAPDQLERAVGVLAGLTPSARSAAPADPGPRAAYVA